MCDSSASSPRSRDFRERLARQLGFYYENLELALGDLPDNRCAWVTLDGLKADLSGTLTAVYGRLGLTLGEPFGACLAREAERSRGYRSGHSYSLEQFALAPGTLDPSLERVYGRLAGRSVFPALPTPSGEAPRRDGPSGATISTKPALPC